MRSVLQHSFKEKVQKKMQEFKREPGIAGLTILLSVVAMVFIIGFLVMIFAIMGANLKQNVATSVTDNASSIKVINDTTNAIGGVTSWFPIIITITVMVSLILLTVIIIVAIRSSGLLAAGQ